MALESAHPTRPAALPRPPSPTDARYDLAVVGLWAGGDRLLRWGDRELLAHVWFDFGPDGLASLRIRCLDEERARHSVGRWSIEGPNLVATFGGREIRARFSVDDDVLYWAGEQLLRFPKDLPHDPPC
jgi:hypothetical protein